MPEQRGDIQFDFFLAGIVAVAIDAADRARQLHRRVTEDRRSLLAVDGVTVTAMQLFERLPDHPVITMSPAATAWPSGSVACN